MRRVRGLAGLLGGKVAWSLLAAIVVVVLAVGSVHPPPSTDAGRISHLDSIIKCPSCDDLSIAQSNASTAVALRAVVAEDVRAGESDSAIESFVVARYGSAILLQPTDALVWALPLVAIAVAAGGVGLLLWRRRRPPSGGDLPVAGGAAGDAAAGRDAVGDSDERLVSAALSRRSHDPAAGVEERA